MKKISRKKESCSKIILWSSRSWGIGGTGPSWIFWNNYKCIISYFVFYYYCCFCI